MAPFYKHAIKTDRDTKKSHVISCTKARVVLTSIQKNTTNTNANTGFTLEDGSTSNFKSMFSEKEYSNTFESIQFLIFNECENIKSKSIDNTMIDDVFDLISINCARQIIALFKALTSNIEINESDAIKKHNSLMDMKKPKCILLLQVTVCHMCIYFNAIKLKYENNDKTHLPQIFNLSVGCLIFRDIFIIPVVEYIFELFRIKFSKMEDVEHMGNIIQQKYLKMRANVSTKLGKHINNANASDKNLKPTLDDENFIQFLLNANRYMYELANEYYMMLHSTFDLNTIPQGHSTTEKYKIQGLMTFKDISKLIEISKCRLSTFIETNFDLFECEIIDKLLISDEKHITREEYFHNKKNEHEAYFKACVGKYTKQIMRIMEQKSEEEQAVASLLKLKNND